MVTKSDIKKMIKYGEIYLTEKFETKVLCLGCRDKISMGSFWHDLTKYFEHIEQEHWFKNGKKNVTHTDFIGSIEVFQEDIVDLTESGDEEDTSCIIKATPLNEFDSIETALVEIKQEKFCKKTSQNNTENVLQQGEHLDEVEEELSRMFEDTEENNSEEQQEELHSGINNTEEEINTEELIKELRPTTIEINCPRNSFPNNISGCSAIPTPEPSPVENRTTNESHSTLKQLLARPSSIPQLRNSVITSVACKRHNKNAQNLDMYNNYKKLLQRLDSTMENEAPDTQFSARNPSTAESNWENEATDTQFSITNSSNTQSNWQNEAPDTQFSITNPSNTQSNCESEAPDTQFSITNPSNTQSNWETEAPDTQFSTANPSNVQSNWENEATDTQFSTRNPSTTQSNWENEAPDTQFSTTNPSNVQSNWENEAPDTQFSTTTQSDWETSAATQANQSWQQNTIYGRIQSFDTVNAYVSTTLPDNTERNLFPVPINANCNRTPIESTANNYMVNSLPIRIPLNQLSMSSIAQQQQNMEKTADTPKNFSYRDYRHQKEQQQLLPSYAEQQSSMQLNSNNCCNYRFNNEPINMQQNPTHNRQRVLPHNSMHQSPSSAQTSFNNFDDMLQQQQNFPLCLSNEKSTNKNKIVRRRYTFQPGTIRCLQCPMKPTFLNQTKYEIHYARFHNYLNPSWETTYCEVCNRRFMNRSMKNHIYTQGHLKMVTKRTKEIA